MSSVSQLLPPLKGAQEEPKPHVSVSQINEYRDCSAYYMFHYIYKIRTQSKSFLTIGKSVAKGLEINFKQKIGSKLDLPIKDIKEVTAQEFKDLMLDTKWDSDEEPGEIKDLTVKLVELYMGNIAATIQPIYVEERITVDIPEIKMPVIFIPDVIDENGIIHDTKTAGKSPSGLVTLGEQCEPPKSKKKQPTDGDNIVTEADQSFQLSGYCLGYKFLTGKMASGVQLDYLIKTKNPKCGYLKSTRTERDIQRFINVANAAIDGIKSGIFMPDEKSWKCGPDKCDFWELCHREF